MQNNDGRPKLPLWFDQRRATLQFEFENGPAIMGTPRVMRPEEIDHLEALLAIAVKVLRHRAQAIEARAAADDAPESSSEGTNHVR